MVVVICISFVINLHKFIGNIVILLFVYSSHFSIGGYVFVCFSYWFVGVVYTFFEGFPDSSVGKESTYSAGEPCWIPGSGRSAGEGIGCPLQYSWASLVAQLVKNLPATWGTWVQSLGWEDPLEKGKAIYSSGLENSMDCIDYGVAKSWTQLRDYHSLHLLILMSVLCSSVMNICLIL